MGSFLASDAGPFSIHPWPPVTKFFLSLNSLTDLQKPTEKISLTQYAALTLTGFIFSFYGMFVKPINYTLTAVNILLFFSSAWHLGRKMKVCFFSGECEVEPLASKPGLCAVADAIYCDVCNWLAEDMGGPITRPTVLAM